MLRGGDIQNNAENLKSQLKKIKYSKVIIFEDLVTNNPSIFLQLIHFVLVDYSQDYYKILIEKNYELYSKNDLRFIEQVYKLMFKEFQYKPSINISQFLSDGFLEHKVKLLNNLSLLQIIFVTDLISNVQKQADQQDSSNKKQKKGKEFKELKEIKEQKDMNRDKENLEIKEIKEVKEVKDQREQKILKQQDQATKENVAEKANQRKSSNQNPIKVDQQFIPYVVKNYQPKKQLYQMTPEQFIQLSDDQLDSSIIPLDIPQPMKLNDSPIKQLLLQKPNEQKQTSQTTEQFYQNTQDISIQYAKKEDVDNLYSLINLSNQNVQMMMQKFDEFKSEIFKVFTHFNTKLTILEETVQELKQ